MIPENTFVTAAPELIHMGYRCTPTVPFTKRPAVGKWTSKDFNPQQASLWADGRAGVGIVCGIATQHYDTIKYQPQSGVVYALDFDIPGDNEAAKELHKYLQRELPGHIYRVGKAPKFLVPVRGIAGMPKRTTPSFEKGELRAQLEVLGKGQQFIAYGIHPKTGEPYRWHGGDPLHTYIDTLPVIDDDFLDRLFAAFKDILERHGWVAEENYCNYDSIIEPDDLLPDQPGLGLSEEQMLAYAAAWDVTDYEDWIEVGMAIHHETRGSEEGYQIWDNWSRQAHNYKGQGETRYHWNSFGKNTGVRQKTMASIRAKYMEGIHDRTTEFTEGGLAARAIKYAEGRFKFCMTTGAWYEWNGVHWVSIPELRVKSHVQFVAHDKLHDEVMAIKKSGDSESLAKIEKFYAKCQTATRIDGAYKQMRLDPAASTLDFVALSKGNIFPVGNGDIDLDTLEFLPPDKARYTLTGSEVNYDPDAKCPLWEETLMQIMDGNVGMIGYMQRICGYAMLGNPTAEIMPVLIGNGCNGKSTFVNAVQDVFGTMAGVMSTATLTSGSNNDSLAPNAHRADLLILRGKRMVLVSETESYAKLREATVKSLVSCDPITARGLQMKTPVVFKPSFVPFLVTNHMPGISGTDNGIWRRLAIINFDQNFEGRKDTGRAEALRKEYSGILNWLLQGVRMYREHGLATPEEVKATTANIRQSQDYLGEWIEERCALEADSKVDTTVIFNSWRAFAESNGYSGYITSKRALTQKLGERGIKSKPALLKGYTKTTRCYFGIKLVDDIE